MKQITKKAFAYLTASLRSSTLCGKTKFNAIPPQLIGDISDVSKEV